MTERKLSKIANHYKHWQENGIAGYPWEKSGEHQFNFLVSKGLKPHHTLLDIGCSCLRGGIHFIDYLDVGNYYGFDKEKELINIALNEVVPQRNLIHKKPVIEVVDNFDQAFLKGTEFDFMLAQSVFTHIIPELVELCLENIVVPQLKQNGKFYATIHEGDELNISQDKHPWRLSGNERRQVFYRADYISDIAADFQLETTYIGQWGPPIDGSDCPLCLCAHPDSTDLQTMLLLTKQVLEL